MEEEKEHQNISDETPETNSSDEKNVRQARHHLIGNKFVRRTLKTLLGVLIVLLMIPVLLYIPPIQTFVKDIACNIVEKSTGMKVGIGHFSLKFPLDVELSDVSVIEAEGDTMVMAGKAVADVKLLPLLKLDVKLNELRLEQGYYRMVSPDSSMIMKIRAGLVNVDGGSFINIRTSEISLRKARLKDGDVALYMNVWKQQPTPQDTTSIPFLITADELDLENIRFGMSMLPTIDTLNFVADRLRLEKGVINLRTNNITARKVIGVGGDASYIAPTPEYVASHPVPPANTTSTSAPFKIKVDTIGLSGFKALYAIKGAKPLPGFDANYISFTDLSIGLKDFYNEATTVRLPLTGLAGKERSGLQITEGSGTVLVDSTGLALDNVRARTLYSNLAVTAGVPFALMEMAPDAPLNAIADVSLGLPDIEAFMPDLKIYTRKLATRNPLTAAVDVAGTLSKVTINKFDAALKGVFSLRAKGFADNALDFKKLRAQMEIDGELTNPEVAMKLADFSGVSVPPLKIKGTAGANGQAYNLNMLATTPQGNVAAKGDVSLTAETYDADIRINNLNVGYFMKDLGIGHITADISAHGAGFNPTIKSANMVINIDAPHLEYNRQSFRDIRADVSLHEGEFTINASSPNSNLDFVLNGNGSIDNDEYRFDVDARIAHIDLKALGFSETENNGNADIHLVGMANPTKWLYDVDLDIASLDWNVPDSYITIPSPLTAHFMANEYSTECDIDGYKTDLTFRSGSGLEKLIDSFMSVSNDVSRQIARRSLDVDSISSKLPPFMLEARASGSGMLRQFLEMSGLGFDSINAVIRKDSILHCRADLMELKTSSLRLDTITLGLEQRGNLLDYALHLGNRPGTLDEFAKVNVTGYLGSNRLSTFVRQQNLEGETGYRIGFTASVNDTTVNVHFTPLKAMIAYMPWNFNMDNEVDVNLKTYAVNANLKASSAESSILLMTEKASDGYDELHVNLKDIKIEDFLKMSVTAPPVTATINSDIRVKYTGLALTGKGNVGITDLTYERRRVGDFDLSLIAGRMNEGRTRAAVGLKVDGTEAVGLYTDLVPDSVGALVPKNVQLKLTDFPLNVANPFLNNMATLSGVINGKMDMTGSFTNPIINGGLSLDSVYVGIPMIGSSLKLYHDPITITDNQIDISNFSIYGVNKNPLVINGKIDARNFSRIGFDMSAAASNFQLVGTDRKTRSDVSGKLFMNLDATAKGNMALMDINANLNILGTTDVTYTMAATEASLTEQSSGDVVKFVNLSDTTKVADDSEVEPSMRMRINAGVTISQGTQATVILAGTGVGSGRVELTPSGTVNYFQNYMGDMSLNGQIALGTGFVRYNIPVMGEKKFIFEEGSYVGFNGPMMNPSFNINAYDPVKVNISSGGNTRNVTLIVGLSITNNLANPKIMFDLSAEDDMSLQNEISAMSPDQRSATAMNLLITGQYTGAGVKNVNSNLVTSNLYGILTSQLNSWAAKAIPGVDLSFGVDQYESGMNGESSTTTSYSYQVSKSLLNNRLKIIVGGNYTTDASADENLSQNLISDISFEYMIKQTNSMSLAAKLFRHKDFENILEGEITETGVGIVLRRRLSDLRRLFRFRFGKRRGQTPVKLEADSVGVIEKREEEKHENER